MENNYELKLELSSLIVYHRDLMTKYFLHEKHVTFTKYQDVDRMKRFNKRINLLFRAVKGNKFDPLVSYEFYETLLEVLIYFKSKIPLKAKLEDLMRVFDSFVLSINEVINLIEEDY
jgi:hypothetical protein